METSFNQKITFSGEAHFRMDGCENKQTCRVRNDTNPYEILI